MGLIKNIAIGTFLFAAATVAVNYSTNGPYGLRLPGVASYGYPVRVGKPEPIYSGIEQRVVGDPMEYLPEGTVVGSYVVGPNGAYLVKIDRAASTGFTIGDYDTRVAQNDAKLCPLEPGKVWDVFRYGQKAGRQVDFQSVRSGDTEQMMACPTLR